MTGHATVGVNDDLAASQTGVTSGTSDHESAGGVDKVNGFLVNKFGGDHFFDHMLLDLTLDLFVSHSVSVLDTHQDGVHAHRLNAFFGVFVLDCHLSLVIGHHPRQDLLVHAFSQTLAKLVGE